MALISIILALLLDRLLRDWHELRDLGWFDQFASSVKQLVPVDNGIVQFCAVMLAPVIGLIMLQVLLHDVLYNLPWFLFSVVVLIYCLGPNCLASEVEHYIDARRLGDDDEALHLAATITDEPASSSPDQQSSDVVRAILSVANERTFTVLFWFMLIGPLGGVVYRLSSRLSKGDEADMSSFADIVQAVMAWLPARMLSAGYAMVGNFEGAIHAYKSRPYEADLSISNYDTLVSIGLGALRDARAEDEIAGIQTARDLVVRSTLMWIAVLALLTLSGWLG